MAGAPEAPDAAEAADGFDAVVLAGGRARRFGGGDKPGAEVGGRPLITWVAGAAARAGRLVVVGPPRTGLPDGATFVREDPPGAGPVPALRTGLPLARAPWLALLAADLPFLRPAHLDRLLDEARRAGAPGAVLVDGDGREQWLAGCWRTGALRAALDGYGGASLRGLLGPLGPVRVALAGDVRPPWYDCDTPEALARAEDLAARPGP
ncbi:molybdenum cofactor guanylyltransferase [Actinomadura yumaensis]|uniref:Molybdenum cofactor guanylyltransferase n=1 Tax=Actinomadura yumaensis TaxID=111807 RepID=A0ABW2CUK1_9ACTN